MGPTLFRKSLMISLILSYDYPINLFTPFQESSFLLLALRAQAQLPFLFFYLTYQLCIFLERLPFFSRIGFF
ncbi:hypothetical protein DITRI_Ditri05aG0032600 [Diplodiscus trichospermus]